MLPWANLQITLYPYQILLDFINSFFCGDEAFSAFSDVF